MSEGELSCSSQLFEGTHETPFLAPTVLPRRVGAGRRTRLTTGGEVRTGGRLRVLKGKSVSGVLKPPRLQVKRSRGLLDN